MAKKQPLYRTVLVDVPANAPYRYPNISQEQAWAVKALFDGKAEAAEQGIVWRMIVGEISQLGILPYYPDTHDTAFMNGRRYAGHHLLRIAQMTPGMITKLPKFGSDSQGGEDDEMPTF